MRFEQVFKEGFTFIWICCQSCWMLDACGWWYYYYIIRFFFKNVSLLNFINLFILTQRSNYWWKSLETQLINNGLWEKIEAGAHSFLCDFTVTKTLITLPYYLHLLKTFEKSRHLTPYLTLFVSKCIQF